MARFVLALHVLAAIVAIGPVTVAASMFPATARRAAADPDGDAPAHLRVLYPICRGYAQVAIVAPVFGFATTGPVHGFAWLYGVIATWRDPRSTRRRARAAAAEPAAAEPAAADTRARVRDWV
ncbi:hypothetical protein ACEZCY_32550 [Streptacidiphilus sp. N1-12]|uniref:Uncharacterized protein n=2 Tax=Streptacidiphilus alkalitolerans TaxID=3342712 RepID=A0ABV6WPE8_9ACTN